MCVCKISLTSSTMSFLSNLILLTLCIPSISSFWGSISFLAHSFTAGLTVASWRQIISSCLRWDYYQWCGCFCTSEMCSREVQYLNCSLRREKGGTHCPACTQWNASLPLFSKLENTILSWETGKSRLTHASSLNSHMLMFGWHCVSLYFSYYLSRRPQCDGSVWWAAINVCDSICNCCLNGSKLWFSCSHCKVLCLSVPVSCRGKKSQLNLPNRLKIGFCFICFQHRFSGL